MLLSKHDEKKSDSDQSEGEFNALGEKVELKMIAEEENEGRDLVATSSSQMIKETVTSYFGNVKIYFIVEN